MVADEVDICGMFEDEVDLATGKGWKPTVMFRVGDPGRRRGRHRRPRWSCGRPTPPPGTGDSMFKTVWFDDNLNGKIKKDTTASLTRGRPGQGADGNVTADNMHDLYNQNDRDGNIDGDLGVAHRFQHGPDRGRPRQGGPGEFQGRPEHR